MGPESETVAALKPGRFVTLLPLTPYTLYLLHPTFYILPKIHSGNYSKSPKNKFYIEKYLKSPNCLKQRSLWNIS